MWEFQIIPGGAYELEEEAVGCLMRVAARRTKTAAHSWSLESCQPNSLLLPFSQPIISFILYFLLLFPCYFYQSFPLFFALLFLRFLSLPTSRSLYPSSLLLLRFFPFLSLSSISFLPHKLALTEWKRQTVYHPRVGETFVSPKWNFHQPSGLRFLLRSIVKATHHPLR